MNVNKQSNLTTICSPQRNHPSNYDTKFPKLPTPDPDRNNFIIQQLQCGMSSFIGDDDAIASDLIPHVDSIKEIDGVLVFGWVSATLICGAQQSAILRKLRRFCSTQFSQLGLMSLLTTSILVTSPWMQKRTANM